MLLKLHCFFTNFTFLVSIFSDLVRYMLKNKTFVTNVCNYQFRTAA